jgi:hypothetical protein
LAALVWVGFVSARIGSARRAGSNANAAGRIEGERQAQSSDAAQQQAT